MFYSSLNKEKNINFNKKKQGFVAEEMAYLFLRQHGLQLITRNYRCRFGEIDLIMADGNDIVFIEVRSRCSLRHGYAHESITNKKIKKIIHTASYYLSDYHHHVSHSRFDVVAIHLMNHEPTIDWIKNAFTLSC